MQNSINTQELINFLISKTDNVKSIEITNMYKIFMDELFIHNRQGTINSYNAILKPVMKYFYENNIKTSYEINNQVISNYVISRKPFVKPQTINKEITALKTMFNVCIRKNYIDSINFDFKRLEVKKTKIESISNNDMRKILEYLNTSHVLDKHKLLFLLMLTTGIRTNELLNIENRNINLNKKKIYLEFTKTHTPRYIYLVDDVIPLIQKLMSNNKYLFLEEDNKTQLTSNALKCFFKRLKRDLDIDVLSPHKVRHFYATNIYNKSKDIYLVSQLLGHTNINTTQIYLDIDNEEHQEKNNYFNPINDFKK